MLPEAVSRRRFMSSAARGLAVGAALPMLLQACGSPSGGGVIAPSSAAANGGSASVRPAASAISGVLPAYIPKTGGPKPDYPSAGPLYEDGYAYYPPNPVKSWTKAPPGLGSKVSAISAFFGPITPTPLEQNAAWQEVHRQLNATVSFSIFTTADLPNKLATIMAGNDLPDILLFNGGLRGTPNLPQFLQQSMADLTPYLSGDAAKDYPNLAAIPTFAWKNSGCAVNGKLYMWPVERYRPTGALVRNVNIYDKEIGANYVPKDSDDFKRVLQQLNKPSAGQYAIGSYQGQAFEISLYAAMFGTPNGWRLGSDGKLTKDYETPEYKEAVGYLRDLVSAQLYHPDSLVNPNNAAMGNYLLPGKIVLGNFGFGVTWSALLVDGTKLNPPSKPLPLPPFPAHAGGKPQHFLGPGFLVTNGMKQAPPERIKELLRIIDWLAAPFGSAEDLLLSYGVPDVDYTIDANGHYTPTAKGNNDTNGVPWKYIVQRPQVMTFPGYPDFAKIEYDFEHSAIPYGVDDPTWGAVSLTDTSKGVLLSKTFLSGLTDILSSRSPLTDFDQLVKDWRSGGGDQIRAEYQQALQDSTK